MAQVYLDGLVKALVKGIALQKSWDQRGQFHIGSIDNLEAAKHTIGELPPEEVTDMPGAEAGDYVT